MWEIAGGPANKHESWHAIDVIASVYGIYREVTTSRRCSVSGLNGHTNLPDNYEGDMTHWLRRVHPAEPDAPSVDDATGLTLIDPRARKAYLVARDERRNGRCLCPTQVRGTDNLTTIFSATFAAPPRMCSAWTSGRRSSVTSRASR